MSLLLAPVAVNSATLLSSSDPVSMGKKQYQLNVETTIGGNQNDGNHRPSPMGDALTAELSLNKQLHREMDRRTAARLDQHELQCLVDRLICDWYTNQNMIERAFARIAELQVQVALATAKPSLRQPAPRHFEWARDLLGKRD